MPRPLPLLLALTLAAALTSPVTLSAADPAPAATPVVHEFAAVDVKPAIAKAYSIKLPKNSEKTFPDFIVTTVTIDPKGRPLTFSMPPGTAEEIKTQLLNTLPKWRYTPAQLNGTPVTCRFRQTIQLQDDYRPDPIIATDLPIPAETLPLITNYRTPYYPKELATTGQTGRVRCTFRISAKGEIKDLKILETTHKAFSESVEKTLELWRYLPATKNGKPIETSAEETLEFSPAAAPKLKLTSSERKAAIAKLGTVYEVAQLDKKPATLTSVAPNYPYELKREGKNGSALCEVILNAEGEILSVKVLKASHKDFGLAAEEALNGSTFEPGLKDGQPVPCRLEIPINFNAR